MLVIEIKLSLSTLSRDQSIRMNYCMERLHARKTDSKLERFRRTFCGEIFNMYLFSGLNEVREIIGIFKDDLFVIEFQGDSLDLG